ncbi:SAM-dependent methyltransferase [Erysipelotrichaceae bacterium]|nr:SAM-dependent methyltransferase [Erysipelotrichaceae bacterium]
MYKEFATIYDSFSDQLFYQQWFDFIKPYLKQDMQILDLGCGSGTLLTFFKNETVELSGLDLSEDMLVAAAEKFTKSLQKVELYHENMVNFHAGTQIYDMILSTCDSINYISSYTDFEKLFKNIGQMLKSGGYFLFDMHSDYTFEKRFNDWSYADADDTTSVLWNTFTEDGFAFEHELTFYCKGEMGLYERFDEIHQQYFYKHAYVEQQLKKNGLKIVEMTTDFTGKYSAVGKRIFYAVLKE